MIANIVILFFLLLMMAFWAKQGLFSSLLHLMMVILAGALAFAFWEPVAFMLLNTGTMATAFAWGVALLLLFGVLLVVLRVLVDKLVPGNLQFPGWANLVGGGVLGIVSGILTAGMFILGLQFMPMDPAVAGYEPYTVAMDGQTEPSGQSLWVPVDTITSDFFEDLSAGVFSPMLGGTSLHAAVPDVAAQAGRFRLGRGYDPFASIVAAPGTVKISETAIVSSPVTDNGVPTSLVEQYPEGMADQFNRAGYELLAVQLDFNTSLRGTFDPDLTLRLPPAQIRLIGEEPGKFDDAAGRRDIVQPIGFSRQDPVDPDRFAYTPATDNSAIAYAFPSASKITWFFLVPQDFSPRWIQVRKLRLPLENIPQDAESMSTLIGSTSATKNLFDESGSAQGDADGDSGEGEVGDMQGPTNQSADQIEQTNALPQTFSKNLGMAFGYTERSGDQPWEINSGTGTVDLNRQGRVGRRNRVEFFYKPDHVAMVRLKLKTEQMHTLLGAARAAAAGVGGVWLEDDRGQGNDSKYFPIAYVLDKDGDKLQISVATGGTFFRSAGELPINQMSREDDLYLYFWVPYNITLTSYHIGQSSQPLRLTTRRDQDD